jgi:putative ABC transport system permease protein
MGFVTRFRNLGRRDVVDAEIAAELRAHVEMAVEEAVRKGMSEQQARRAARLRFGNPVTVSEKVSEADMLLLPWSVIEDLRFGLRQLWHSPVFTLTAVLTLALGIGANTAIFSVANAVLLQSLPWPGAGRMVAIHERLPRMGMINDSWPDYQDWRAQNDVFEDMALLQTADFTVTQAGSSESLPGASVTNSFFSLFGAGPILGRTFTTAESAPGANPAAVVSWSFWQQYLGGDSRAVGKTIELDGQAATVVGVLPRGFSIPWGAYQVYLPIEIQADTPQMANRANHPGLQVVAKLRPGVTLQAAGAEMNSIMQRLGRAYPQADRDESAVLAPLLDQFVGEARETLLLLLAATGLVLFLACANVANMALARSAARQREFAVRTSLGAGRGRLFRQALTENLPVAALGGAAGLGLAALVVGPLVHLYPDRLFRLETAHLNGTVLGFAGGLSLASWLLFGIVPAIAACRRTDTFASLRIASAGSRSSHHARLLSVLLVVEIAIALVVTVSTGLLLRSLSAVMHVDPGFRAENLLAIQGVHGEHPGTSPQNVEFYRTLLGRLRHLPGVQDASAAFSLPLHGAFWTSPYVPDGRPQAANTQQPWTEINIVMPGYFQTTGIRLLGGRFLSDTDEAGSTPVAVVNQAMARTLANGTVTGRQIYVQYAPHAALQIVGVVADVKQFGLDRAVMPEVYVPATQAPLPSMDIVLRTSVKPDLLEHAVVMAVHDFDENQPSPKTVSMGALLDAGLGDRRFVSLLLGLFDALALVLAIVGVSGVVSYTVEQRAHEIGVRMALGANRGRVLAMVLRGGLGRVGIGLALGIPAAIGAGRTFASQLFGIRPWDPGMLALATLLLAVAALAAAAIPARRAASIDPMWALRSE